METLAEKLSILSTYEETFPDRAFEIIQPSLETAIGDGNYSKTHQIIALGLGTPTENDISCINLRKYQQILTFAQEEFDTSISEHQKVIRELPTREIVERKYSSKLGIFQKGLDVSGDVGSYVGYCIAKTLFCLSPIGIASAATYFTEMPSFVDGSLIALGGMVTGALGIISNFDPFGGESEFSRLKGTCNYLTNPETQHQKAIQAYIHKHPPLETT